MSEFFKNRPTGPEKVIDISIIVPVFNEAEALVEVCQGVRRELTQIGITWELIFIDDGSTDSTEEILEQLAEEDQRVRVIHFKRNFGQTAAMMAGFDHARGEVIIPLDGDGQNDPADIPQDARAAGHRATTWSAAGAKIARTITSSEMSQVSWPIS